MRFFYNAWRERPMTIPKSQMKNGLFSGLASKITLPFVALFAVLLLILGWILASDILSDVEARVENDQRFVLEVAAFPGWPLADESLRQIRDRARPRNESGNA